MTLAQQLRALVKRMGEASFSRDRASVIADAVPVIEKAAIALEARKVTTTSIAPIDPDLAKLLAALGKGTEFPGREFYINHPKAFDNAAKALIQKFNFEEVRL